jgi:hypothetical protein
VVLSDGTRHLGVLTIDGESVRCAGADGESHRWHRRRIAEIVGPHAELIPTTRAVRLAHRRPDPDAIMRVGLAPTLDGDPEGLKRLQADDRWEIWCAPGSEARRLARDLRKHLRGITNRMKAFFPKGAKPTEPCKVRVFPAAGPFTAWRDRARHLDALGILRAGLVRFYAGENAVMRADLRARGGAIAERVDAFGEVVERQLGGSTDPRQLLAVQLALDLLARALAERQSDAKVEQFLKVVLNVDRNAAGGSSTTPAPSGPRPGGEGEATFINYGYYSPLSEELVVWQSDEMWSTLSHEAFHYWLQHNCPDAPIWINEGFATYFETFAPRQRTEYQGFHFQRYEEIRAVAAQGGLVPLADLLVVSVEVWQAQPGPLQSMLYAQSWAFIHYLLHSDEYDFGNKGEKLLKRYLTSLAEGASAEEARDRHFGDEDSLEEIEESFHYYLSRLKRPDRF